MEVILSYLDNMFLNLPKTAEILRAKEELASMMEDKYTELMAEGKKENEAIGIVISEFGDLEELAKELGIGSRDFRNYGYKAAEEDGKDFEYGAADKYGTGTEESYGAGPEKNCGSGIAGNYGTGENAFSARFVSRNEAMEYMALSEKTSKWIAMGVALCIYCPIFILFCVAIDDSVKRLSDKVFVICGLVPLFLMIGIAVAIFIYNGMKMEKFEYLKKQAIQIDPEFEMELAVMEEKEKPGATLKLIIGVVMCIFSVIPLLVWGSILSVMFLLIVIGIAVAFIIIGTSRLESIKVLRQEGDFTINHKKSSKMIDVIGGIYWPIVTLIYLAWSFWTMKWGFTWIIWPIAGVLFGVIAAVCNVVHGATENSWKELL